MRFQRCSLTDVPALEADINWTKSKKTKKNWPKSPLEASVSPRCTIQCCNYMHVGDAIIAQPDGKQHNARPYFQPQIKDDKTFASALSVRQSVSSGVLEFNALLLFVFLFFFFGSCGVHGSNYRPSRWTATELLLVARLIGLSLIIRIHLLFSLASPSQSISNWLAVPCHWVG